MSTNTWTHGSPGTSAAAWRADPRWAAVPEPDLLAGVDRIVVVAAHPDDETLGAAALTAQAHAHGLAVDLVLVTAGEHSHPGSPTVTPAELATRRLAESRSALAVVAPGGALHQLGIEDGTVEAHADEVTRCLVDLVGDGRTTLLVAPWRCDGHPDHDALGRSAAAAAVRTGARLLEHPVWAWHRLAPDRLPWAAAVRLSVPPTSPKAAAVAAHATQVAPLSDRPGDEVLLTSAFLEHFADAEVFLGEPLVDSSLDDLHAANPEPWHTDERWYERRKRALVLAALPRERYGAGLEVGCSTGVLAVDLAGRCERLVGVDASAHAVAAARRRGVDARRLVVPDEWPAGRYDLVVVSETAYFLSPVALERLAQQVLASLADDGTVVLCHWRHPVDGWVLTGEQAHDRLVALLDLRTVAAYEDRDVRLAVLGAPTPEPSA